MAAPKLSRELAKQVVDAVAKYGNRAAAARALGIPAKTFDHRYDRARAYGLLPPAKPAPAHAAQPDKPGPDAVPMPTIDETLRDRVYELEAQLKTVRSATLTDEYVKRKIIKLEADVSGVTPPRWTVGKPPRPRLPGVPTTMWSDWHWGEVVLPNQIGGVNEFNLEIAHDRAKRLVERVIYLLRQHIVNPDYPGIVICLGGDMMSGDIHEELTNTNEIPAMPCLLDLFGTLKWAISTMADEFGAVFLPCVTGNHGRNTRKPRAKDRNFTNFDWLLYQFLAQTFQDDSRVQFFIPDGPDAFYRVYGHRMLMTHGDQFRGGDGMIGHFGPVLRGHKKKLSRNANVGQEFDVMMHGHFHTYFPTQKIIGNGSLKGYDEYAASENFGYEPPIQALWMTHHEHGITQHLPVYLEPHAGRAKSTEWVSWKDAA